MSPDIPQAHAQLDFLGYSDGDIVYYRIIPSLANGQRAQKIQHKAPFIPDQPEGSGLYLVVNGQGDTDQSIKTGRAFWCEWDDRPLTEQETLWDTLGFLEPTFQVKTRKSIHCYWVLQEPVPIDQWSTIQSRLLEALDGDRSIKNPSRVLRVAGSWHFKDGEEPIQCQLINATGKKYSLSEIVNAIPSNPHWSDGILFVEPEPKKSKLRLTSPTAIGDSIPLEIALAPSSRDLIAGGCSENRNATGAKLARDILGTEQYFISNGIAFSGDGYQLFVEFCHRCPSHDWSQKEWDGIWDKAKKSNPSPSLSSDKIETCINSYLKRQGKQSLLQVNKPDSVGNSDKATLAKITKLGDNCKALEFIKEIWGGNLAFNLRTLEIELKGHKLDLDQAPMIIADRYQISISKDRVSDCAYYLAKQNEYDPFLSYLESVKDLSDEGISKETLAPLLFFTDDPYYKEILWLFMLSIVKRAYEPGCKWDNTLVLQGKQHIGKSTFFQTLVGSKFFADTMTAKLGTDDLRLLHAHPVCEWAELGNFTARQFADVIKHFLSRQKDQFRLPYARDIVTYLRRSVIVGTVNEEQFLTDLTGNRRFMVLPCTQIIRPEILETMRDNIFAAVLKDYFANWQGKPLELPQPMRERQNFENEGYLHSDILQDALGEILDGQEGMEFTMAEIMQRLQVWRNGLLELKPGDRSTQMRLAKILNQYGWGKKQRKVNGQNTKIWAKKLTK
jgi:hypothetical protein